MIGLGIITEIGALAAYDHWSSHKETTSILQCKHVKPRAIPILDNKIRVMAGATTKFQKANAARIIKLARFITSTQAFEYAIQGLLNPNSKMRKKRRRVLEVSTYL